MNWYANETDFKEREKKINIICACKNMFRIENDSKALSFPKNFPSQFKISK